MSRTTFTPCLKKKYKTDREGIINIRQTENRKSKYHSLKITIDEKCWNAKRCEVKSNFKESEELNNLIRSKVEELKQQQQTNDHAHLEATAIEGSFIELFNNQLAFLLARKRIGTYKSHNTSLGHFKEFLKTKGKLDVEFSKLDNVLIRDFETYLLDNSISINSSKKYISVLKKIYTEGIKLNFLEPRKDPFLLFENRRVPVNKDFLTKLEVEQIMSSDIDESDPLFHVKNYFLFQIFAQGLRVSDLVTLRWENLVDGKIKFVQLKTKKTHTVHLNFINVSILKDYVPGKCKEILSQKFAFTIDGKNYSLSLNELKEKYQAISKENISNFINGDQKAIDIITRWKEALDEVKEKIKFQIILNLTEYSRNHKTDFIFPILNSKNFQDVRFDHSTTLTKFQFNQIGSKTAVYNKQLKSLQTKCEIGTILTSHLSRHTYTNLMIETTDRDIYSISKSLGHQRLSTTDHYVNEFLSERAENANNDFVNNFGH